MPGAALSGRDESPLGLAAAVSLALSTDVVAQHGPEDKIFLGGKLAERSRHHHPYRLQALATAKEEIEAVVAHGQEDVVDMLMAEAVHGIVLILLVEREEHHLAHSLLVLIDMVHQYLHIYG